ncbi:hypothetical protein M378DRAFT_173048 [Amanita muscaria Koide BX008]|uniref:Uncharacterized protein n=1 Tax=Amanita muscaria (strain Koide BX008) TaxID=946122 RepID=A0A0C2W4K6_AMAMK|nr:hypothetical protein M378DRAFT_173048 [Amanita muscaria Koide BX008]
MKALNLSAFAIVVGFVSLVCLHQHPTLTSGPSPTLSLSLLATDPMSRGTRLIVSFRIIIAN